MNQQVSGNSHQGQGTVSDAMEIFLHPGELYFGSAPTVLSSSLRSRVIVTFWHPETRIGGMCHIVLAMSPGGDKDMRYGNNAIAEFSALAKKYQTQPAEYEARIIGGSGLSSEMQGTIGQKNGGIDIKQIQGLLASYGFKVTDTDIANVNSRKVKFDLENGKLNIVNSAESSSNEILLQQEKEEKEKINSPVKESDSAFAMEIFLHPGELYYGRAPTIVSTLLGSCVAVTLWHPKELLGGMCHIVLPESGAGIACDMKYGDCALAEFSKQAIKFSTKTEDYVVNVYGGSDMFPDMKKSAGMKIGERNIEKVNQLLQLYKFKVNEIDTGGTSSRKIKLDLSDGSVTTRKTNRTVEG